MSLTFYWYPNCGTCKKAKKWLDEEGIDYESVHIVNNPPSEEQLKSFIATSDKPAKKFFNTSGKKYRELNMKEKLKEAEEAQMIEWLASDGMLIKRPILTDGEKTTVGFKQEEFENVWAQ
ncbi:arsenate reductase family protein [Halobacillus sp. GSS1]|uniref:arsenate reductase family protein n=1 Tax=Halobacillus sp. GSS1 TaxID=2815919 RepID=UPI001A8C7158|nr:arsenate reductase family protein [Halobacillus sp. GSS1]MBN9655468.1 arsenate reductase family protein [Halobacillus sp. GSS1]